MSNKLLSSVVLAAGLSLSANSAEAKSFQVDGVACLDSEQYPKSTGPINDYADLLDEKTEKELSEQTRSLEAKNGDELVVLTVKSLQGQTVEDYSKCLGTAWGVGKKDLNNGVLLVVAPTERKTRIQTGSGAKERLTDEESSRIIENQALPSFKTGDYQQGINNSVHEMIEELDGTTDKREEEERQTMLFFAKMLGLGVAGVITFSQALKYKQRYSNIQKLKRYLDDCLSKVAEMDKTMADIKLRQPQSAWEGLNEGWLDKKDFLSKPFSVKTLMFDSQEYSYRCMFANHTGDNIEEIESFIPALEKTIQNCKNEFFQAEKDWKELQESLAENKFSSKVTELVSPIEQLLSKLKEEAKAPTNEVWWENILSQTKHLRKKITQLDQQVCQELKILRMTPEELADYRDKIQAALERKLKNSSSYSRSNYQQLQSMQSNLNSSAFDSSDPLTFLLYFYFLQGIDQDVSRIPTESSYSPAYSSNESSNFGGSSFGGGSFGGGDMSGGGGASGSW